MGDELVYSTEIELIAREVDTEGQSIVLLFVLIHMPFDSIQFFPTSKRFKQISRICFLN